MALGILVGLLRGGRAVPKSGIGALTSKRGPRNFYKGKGCKSTGRHTSKGFFLSFSPLSFMFVSSSFSLGFCFRFSILPSLHTFLTCTISALRRLCVDGRKAAKVRGSRFNQL